MAKTFKPARLTYHGIPYLIDREGAVHPISPASNEPGPAVDEPFAAEVRAEARRLRAKRARRIRNEVYASLGMTRVRGNLGGTYYE